MRRLIPIGLGTAAFLAIMVILIGACAPSGGSVTPPSGSAKAVATPTVSPSQEGEISLDKNFYIILDGSGSMGDREYAGTFPSKIQGAKWALKEFVSRGVPQEANLGLYVFDGKGERERIALGKDNRQQIVAAVEAVSAGSGTPLNGAIKRGVEALAKQRDKQLGYGAFYLVVVTDGMATDGDSGAGEGVRFAIKKEIPIITIGFGLKQEHPLAKYSLSYRNALSPDELLRALQETQAESEYLDTTVSPGR